MQEPTYKIVSRHDRHNDTDTSHYVICVNMGGHRAHLHVEWSGIRGTPFTGKWEPEAARLDFNLCDCDSYKEGVPHWMREMVRRYLKRFPGKSARATLPLEMLRRGWHRAKWIWDEIR